MSKVMEMYQPGAVVMCCGADSLSGDRLGCFNLSMDGHSKCLEFLSKYHVPMLVLGGGGYTLRNGKRTRRKIHHHPTFLSSDPSLVVLSSWPNAVILSFVM